MCPVGGPQATSNCSTAAGPSLGDERLQQPRGVAQQTAGTHTHSCLKTLYCKRHAVYLTLSRIY